MASFIMAMSINPSAKKLHDDLGRQINASFDIFQENNVKVTQLMATLGRYDYLALFDAPDQNLAFKVASQINSRGILETETWPVIPFDEFSSLL